MILERYNYKYALIPHAEAKKMGLGWRKTDDNGMVLMNLAELKLLPGEGTIEQRVEAAGGYIMLPEEAHYYRHTNNFSFKGDHGQQGPVTEKEPLPDGGPRPEEPPIQQEEEIDPGFTQGGTNTELPPQEQTEDIDPGFTQDVVAEELKPIDEPNNQE